MCMYNLKQLHHLDNPLLIGNIWDAHSAKLAEKAGFSVLGTSSTAISNTLGYEDGEGMSFDELFFVVKHIVKAVQVPVSIDIEAGYSRNVQEINEHIKRLIEIGVAGINIEDSIVTDSVRKQVPTDSFANLLKEIRFYLDKNNYDLFINARTDGYLLGNPDALKITLERINAFEAAGADGIFIPGIATEEDIATVVKSTRLPINTYILPGVPSYDRQQQLGVKRISSGGAAQGAAYSSLNTLFTNLAQAWDFEGLFKK